MPIYLSEVTICFVVHAANFTPPILCTSKKNSGRKEHLMATIEAIKAAAQKVVPSPRYGRYGCFSLGPPVALVERRTGKVVHADQIDVNGEYPQTVHVEERGFWWNIAGFDLSPTE
jgi:hypothetical protein